MRDLWMRHVAIGSRSVGSGTVDTICVGVAIAVDMSVDLAIGIAVCSYLESLLEIWH
jgi:hypothetical protein